MEPDTPTNGNAERSPAEVIDLAATFASKFNEAARAPNGGGDGAPAAHEPLAALMRSLDQWGRSVQEHVQGIEHKAEDLEQRCQGLASEVNGVKSQADRTEQQALGAQDQIRQTLLLLGQQATRIDALTGAANEDGERIARLEAAVARAEEEVAGVRAENGRLRRSVRVLRAVVIVALIAIAAGAGWMAWPKVVQVLKMAQVLM